MKERRTIREKGCGTQAALPSLATNADGSYMKLPLWTDEWIEARGKIRVLLEFQVCASQV